MDSLLYQLVVGGRATMVPQPIRGIVGREHHDLPMKLAGLLLELGRPLEITAIPAGLIG